MNDYSLFEILNMQNDENGGMIMTILFKCDKVIRSMKNKIVKKGERKSMKKRKYLALLLAAGMIAQTALSTGGVVQVQAAEDT